jgi:uncharacterized membrane protein YfcA
MASIASALGAFAGLRIDEGAIRIVIGITIMAICIVMVFIKPREHHFNRDSDFLSRLLMLNGRYFDEHEGRTIEWSSSRSFSGLVFFAGAGFLAGLLGIGAGWANVPILNLIMAVPLKIAVGTSILMIGIIVTPAATVYLFSGAVLAYVTVPSVMGVLLGSKLGALLIGRASTEKVRLTVTVLLFIAGVLSIYRGIQQLL